MAIGDAADMQSRLQLTLPGGWFGDSTPVLDATLAGFAAAFAFCFSLLSYVQQQTRIATATDVNLDLVAQDFFASGLSRNPGEGDAVFRARIQQNLLAPAATRSALVRKLALLTGKTPIVFEPANALDTGGYGIDASLAYGAAGGWGSLALPYQFFVTAFRPEGGAIAHAAGYGSPAGGYDVGLIEYVNPSMQTATVSDAEIYAATASALPVGATAWTALGGAVSGGLAPLGDFVLGTNLLGFRQGAAGGPAALGVFILGVNSLA